MFQVLKPGEKKINFGIHFMLQISAAFLTLYIQLAFLSIVLLHFAIKGA